MSEAHTPGPWAVSKNEDYVFGRQQGNGLEPLGFVYGPAFAERSAVGRRAMADARLIAAAPELLEALKLLIEEVQWNREGPIQDGLLICVNKAVAAISKATEAA